MSNLIAKCLSLLIVMVGIRLPSFYIKMCWGLCGIKVIKNKSEGKTNLFREYAVFTQVIILSSKGG